MPSLFGNNTPFMGAAKMAAGSVYDQKRQQQPQQRPGLFGRMQGFMGRSQDGISNGDRLSAIGALLRDDPSIGQNALAMQQQQRSMFADRQAEQQAQDGQRNTQQKAQMQAQQLIEQQADALGLQGEARARFMLAPEPVRQEAMGRMVNPEAPDAPNIQTIYNGDQAEQGYFDQNQQWVPMGGGQRFRPQQTQQGPAWRNLSSEEVAQRGYAPGDVVQINDRTGQEVRRSAEPRERTFNQQQSMSAEFANRAAQANQTIERLYTPDNPDTPENEGARNNYNPTAMVRPRNMGIDFMRGDTARQWDQAAEQFALSVLRRESGAAISANERSEIESTYFPQPGDGPETIRQKAEARRTVIGGMASASQGAYEQYYGDSPYNGQSGQPIIIDY